MAATDYAGLTAALVAWLRDAPGFQTQADAGRPIHVADSMIPPTMEQCPAVLVLPQSAEKRLTRIAMASPSNEHVTYVVTCWAFSAEDSGDAGRQRSELVTRALDAIERDRTLDGAVCGLEVGPIAFRPVRLDDGLFATADITVRLLVQS